MKRKLLVICGLLCGWGTLVQAMGRSPEPAGNGEEGRIGTSSIDIQKQTVLTGIGSGSAASGNEAAPLPPQSDASGAEGSGKTSPGDLNSSPGTVTRTGAGTGGTRGTGVGIE